MILAAPSAQPSAETFTTVMDHVAQGFEALGALILVVGIVWSFVLAVVTWRRSGQPSKGYLALRTAVGGTLLLGLEILVAANLVRTVAVAPTLNNVLVLGLIVFDQDGSELLAGDRDRGCCAVETSTDERRGGDPPGLGQHAEVQTRPVIAAPKWGPVAATQPSRGQVGKLVLLSSRNRRSVPRYATLVSGSAGWFLRFPSRCPRCTRWR